MKSFLDWISGICDIEFRELINDAIKQILGSMLGKPLARAFFMFICI